MSWDSYLDNLIAQTKDASGNVHCDKACIIGLDGGAAWTTNAAPNAFKVSQYWFSFNELCLCLGVFFFNVPR